jgi:large subunit ribosomal protein L18e
MRKTGPTNVMLRKTIDFLREQSKKNDAAIWKRVANDLARSTRSRYVVNLSKIDRITSEGDIVIVPGKILGDGALSHKVSVSAFSLSTSAKEKLDKSDSSFLAIEELIKKYPKGSNIKLII